MNNTQSFPSEIIKKLRTYVYRLIDPRNGETFYVGKGKGDRVFSHMRAEDGLDDDEINKKFERIRQIRNAGFGVEAALIDAYPGLTYIAGGTGGSDFGVMHAEDIIRRYSAESATFRHKARTAEVVLSTIQGLIVAAYTASEWLEATAANFSGRTEAEGAPGRYGFVGTEAPAAVKELYVGKRVPDQYRRRGAANPVKYTW